MLMAPLDQLDSPLALLLLFGVSCFLLVVVKGFRSGRMVDCDRTLPPPSPPALPVIGNLHQLGNGHHLHRRLQALAQSYGPLFLLRLGSMPTLVVSSPSMAEAVLRTHDHVFCSRSQQYTSRAMLYGCRDIVFGPYDERWRQLRRIAVVHLLSAKRVDFFRKLREEEVASFLERIRSRATGVREDEGVNVSELLVSLTSNVISRAAFGNKLGGMEPGMIHDMIEEVSDLLGTITVSDRFPRLRWVDWATGLDARVTRTAAKLDDILERTLEEHEKSRGGNDSQARDLLDDLLSILKDGDQGFKLDRIDVKALILDMFLAGTDTSHKTIEWTMAELIKNPREMKKVQAQARQVAGAQGVHEEELGKMDMLHAAIKEALRLHPPVPLLIPRETIEDTQLHGYDVQARTRVIINAWAIGRDTDSWENAKEFRPERFMGKAIDYGDKDPRFIPFGGGRRGCPGIAFGTRLVELTLANMIYHFDWKLPGCQDPESFELLESSGFSPGLKSSLILAVKSM